MKKLFFYVVAAAIALTSCSSEDVVEVNNNGNAIDFRVAMGPGANSRGLVTTETNLKEFFVTAVYDESHGNYFANELFVFDGHAKFNKSADRFMWPTEKLNFYAYSYGVEITKDNDGEEGGGHTSFSTLFPDDASRENVFGKVTINYDDNLKKIIAKFTDFTPNTDISKQIDFVTAKASGSGTSEEKTNGVALTFEHALSQIQILALKDDPEYNYNIRGVKIVNVISKDEFNMVDNEWLNSTEDHSAYSTANGNLGSYSITYRNPIALTEDPANIMLEGNGSAMLIPQELTAWKPENAETSTGAYIAVLLQVNMEGTGTQAYPLTKTGESYAWAVIPIDTTWEIGYKYVYTLDFSNGAGYDEISGEKIFDETINYTCNVTPWNEEDSDQSTPM